MTLDLRASDAKVARATEHCRVLKDEFMAALRKTDPYHTAFTDVDPQTGWCELWLVPNHLPEEPRLGVIFGDVIHNLRCALDYIVTELVKASDAKLTTGHEFPIFYEKQVYESKVGPVGAPKPSGPLAHVTHGLALIESLQPYHLQPEPRRHPLWAVHRFSNADKHRQPGVVHLPFDPGVLQLEYVGTLVENVPAGDVPDWHPHDKTLLARLRFNPPVASNLNAKGNLSMRVGFGTEAFRGQPDHRIGLNELSAACEYVEGVVELFKSL